MYKYLTTLLLLCVLSCKSADKKQQTFIEKQHTVVEQPDLIKEIKNMSQLSEDEIKELADGSRIGPMTIYNTKDTLEVISEGELTNSLLGDDISDSGIQECYNNIFKIEHQIVDHELLDKALQVSKFLYKDSFIKVHNDQNQCWIVSGRIINKEIFMARNIQLGIPKKDFFNKIFKNASAFDFNSIDTFRNSDFMGDILQEFIFKADTLNRVIISSGNGVIPFEL